MKTKRVSKKRVKAWAVVNGGYVITESVAYGHGAAVCLARMKGVYPTKREAEDMRVRWKNADDFEIVPCVITYSV